MASSYLSNATPSGAQQLADITRRIDQIKGVDTYCEVVTYLLWNVKPVSLQGREILVLRTYLHAIDIYYMWLHEAEAAFEDPTDDAWRVAKLNFTALSEKRKQLQAQVASSRNEALLLVTTGFHDFEQQVNEGKLTFRLLREQMQRLKKPTVKALRAAEKTSPALAGTHKSVPSNRLVADRLRTRLSRLSSSRSTSPGSSQPVHTRALASEAHLHAIRRPASSVQASPSGALRTVQPSSSTSVLPSASTREPSISRSSTDASRPTNRNHLSTPPRTGKTARVHFERRSGSFTNSVRSFFRSSTAGFTASGPARSSMFAHMGEDDIRADPSGSAR